MFSKTSAFFFFKFKTLRNVLRRVAHHQIESSRRNFAESTVAVERNGNRDRRVVAGKFHSARDEQIVKLVDVHRLARFT